MNIISVLTSLGITMSGGLLATGIAAISEIISNETTVATGSILLGSAGLIAAISAFTKDFWSDRQKQRENELAKLRLRLQGERLWLALNELHQWAKAAHLSDSTLPSVPDLTIEAGKDHDDEATTS